MEQRIDELKRRVAEKRLDLLELQRELYSETKKIGSLSYLSWKSMQRYFKKLTKHHFHKKAFGTDLFMWFEYNVEPDLISLRKIETTLNRLPKDNYTRINHYEFKKSADGYSYFQFIKSTVFSKWKSIKSPIKLFNYD